MFIKFIFQSWPSDINQRKFSMSSSPHGHWYSSTIQYTEINVKFERQLHIIFIFFHFYFLILILSSAWILACSLARWTSSSQSLEPGGTWETLFGVRNWPNLRSHLVTRILSNESSVLPHQNVQFIQISSSLADCHGTQGGWTCLEQGTRLENL